MIGTGWSCDWPTHEGKVNAFTENDPCYGCETIFACNFGICITCYTRIHEGHDTYSKDSPVSCVTCGVGLFRYPASFIEEYGTVNFAFLSSSRHLM